MLLESAKITPGEKRWVGKFLSDRIKACVNFTPTTSQFVKIDASKCDGCGLCYKYCMGGVIDLDEQTGKAFVARLETCMECGACYQICPTDAIDWTYPEGGTGIICQAPIFPSWD